MIRNAASVRLSSYHWIIFLAKYAHLLYARSVRRKNCILIMIILLNKKLSNTLPLIFSLLNRFYSLRCSLTTTKMKQNSRMVKAIEKKIQKDSIVNMATFSRYLNKKDGQKVWVVSQSLNYQVKSKAQIILATPPFDPMLHHSGAPKAILGKKTIMRVLT